MPTKTQRQNNDANKEREKLKSNKQQPNNREAHNDGESPDNNSPADAMPTKTQASTAGTAAKSSKRHAQHREACL